MSLKHRFWLQCVNGKMNFYVPIRKDSLKSKHLLNTLVWTSARTELSKEISAVGFQCCQWHS